MPFPTVQKLDVSALRDSTSPATVYYQGKLYVFYIDGNGYLFYTTYDGASWTGAEQPKGGQGIGIAPWTSPCVVMFRDALYVFYNGVGNDGTFYTVLSNGQWRDVVALGPHTEGGFLPGTSPAAVVFQNALFLFWNGSGDNGIFWSTFDGYKWGKQKNVRDYATSLSSAKRTSPAATVFKGNLYLFFNGSGDDGTYYALYSNGLWTRSLGCMSDFLGGQSFLPGTSPAVLNYGDDFSFELFWTGRNNDGTWHTNFNGNRWSSQKSLSQELGAQGMKHGTSACADFINLVPHVFWVGQDGQLRYVAGANFEVATDDWFPVQQCLATGTSFTVLSRAQQDSSKLTNLPAEWRRYESTHTLGLTGSQATWQPGEPSLLGDLVKFLIKNVDTGLPSPWHEIMMVSTVVTAVGLGFHIMWKIADHPQGPIIGAVQFNMDALNFVGRFRPWPHLLFNR